MDCISVGDAVVPRDEADHDVMTVYDIEGGRNYAADPHTLVMCNWVVVNRMFKRNFRAAELRLLQRRKVNRER